jgi:hypothetical protein
MKNETAIAAIRQVYKGAFHFTQYVDTENNIKFAVILQPNFDLFPIAKYEADTFTEAVEGVIQKVMGMIPATKTIKDLNDLNDELPTLIKKEDLPDEKEQTMAQIIDIRDCIL